MRAFTLMVCAMLMYGPACQRTAPPSPGPLSPVHAMRHCPDCHAGTQDDRCRDCHLELSQRLATGHGLHLSPRSPRVQGVPCAHCHKEHQGGRDLDGWTAIGGRDSFNHASAGMRLAGGPHAKLDCQRCHPKSPSRQGYLAPETLTCQPCHGDTHEGSLGADCLVCHNGESWTAPRFQHERQTKYPLQGKHLQAPCRGCHLAAPRRYKPAPTICVDCHRKDDIHRGTNGLDCTRCHDTAGWKPARISVLPAAQRKVP